MPKFTAFSTALALLLSGCLLSDTLDASYASMAEAVSKEAVAKGWIPEWLPEDAANIREVHNLDTNTSALAFDIPPHTEWHLPEHCRPVSFNDTSPSVFNRSWWPSDDSLASSYSFFQCKADASPDFAFVGISKTGTRGLHWRTYAR
jgi:hypothetical protein